MARTRGETLWSLDRLAPDFEGRTDTELHQGIDTVGGLEWYPFGRKRGNDPLAPTVTFDGGPPKAALVSIASNAWLAAELEEEEVVPAALELVGEVLRGELSDLVGVGHVVSEAFGRDPVPKLARVLVRDKPRYCARRVAGLLQHLAAHHHGSSPGKAILDALPEVDDWTIEVLAALGCRNSMLRALSEVRCPRVLSAVPPAVWESLGGKAVHSVLVSALEDPLVWEEAKKAPPYLTAMLSVEGVGEATSLSQPGGWTLWRAALFPSSHSGHPTPPQHTTKGARRLSRLLAAAAPQTVILSSAPRTGVGVDSVCQAVLDADGTGQADALDIAQGAVLQRGMTTEVAYGVVKWAVGDECMASAAHLYLSQPVLRCCVAARVLRAYTPEGRNTVQLALLVVLVLREALKGRRCCAQCPQYLTSALLSELTALGAIDVGAVPPQWKTLVHANSLLLQPFTILLCPPTRFTHPSLHLGVATAPFPSADLVHRAAVQSRKHQQDVSNSLSPIPSSLVAAAAAAAHPALSEHFPLQGEGLPSPPHAVRKATVTEHLLTSFLT